MKMAGFILVAVSLAVAILGAVSAYLPPLSLPDEQLDGLTLNAPAGAVRDEAGKLQPIAPQDAILTPELIAKLRAAGVKRVQVKEFAFKRWTGAALFILGSIGLLIGGLMLSRAAGRAVAPVEGKPLAGEPGQLLQEICEEMENLKRRLPEISGDKDRRNEIIERVGELQRVQVPLFIGTRPILVSRLRLSGYARLMDVFSAGERQMNRAWSAAADGVTDEAAAGIEQAASLLGEAFGLFKETGQAKR
jgi:hypothetical protein